MFKYNRTEKYVFISPTVKFKVDVSHLPMALVKSVSAKHHYETKQSITTSNCLVYNYEIIING